MNEPVLTCEMCGKLTTHSARGTEERGRIHYDCIGAEPRRVKGRVTVSLYGCVGCGNVRAWGLE